jgi:CBS domain-containing protein
MKNGRMWVNRILRPGSENALEGSMLRLRDIMTTDVITLDPNVTIREAMDVFTSKRITGAPVVAGNEVIGVVSASDLLQFAAAMPGLPPERDAPEDWIDEIADEDEDEAPLASSREDDDPSALYFTDLVDDASAGVVDRNGSPAGVEWNALEEHTVSEAMTRAPVHALTPDTLVTVAAGYMRRAEIHRVLVMTGKTLVGLVSSTDITDAVADGKLTSHTYVFEHTSRSGERVWDRRR